MADMLGLALVVLCSGIPAAPATRGGPGLALTGGQLALTLGHETVPVEAALLLDHRSHGGGGTPRPRRIRLTGWSRSAARPGCLASRARTPDVDVQVRACVGGADPRVRLGVTVTYRRDTWPRLEALELRLPVAAGPSVRVLGRDLRLIPLPRRGAHADRWTPGWVLGDAPGGLRWAVHTDAHLDRLLVTHERRAARGRHGRAGTVRVRLELDDVRNHPLRYHRKCVPKWRPRLPTVDRSARQRRRGEVVKRRAWLSLARATRAPVPLWIHRWPSGRRAAVVFTGHADQARERATRAVAWGAGRKNHPRYGKGGFLGHGLPYTMTFFWGGARFYQPAQRKGFAALVRRMRRHGCDIGLHSATPLPDDRRTMQGALRWFQSLGARTWIDHSPATNCEAWASHGWNPRSRWYIGDLLAKHGIRYLWAGRDAGHLPWRSLNLLAPQAPRRRRYLLFRHDVGIRGAPKGFWFWTSQWTYETRGRALRRWGPKRLDQLERERGVHVAHVYLDALHPPRHALYARNLLIRARDGTPVVHPGFERVLADLSRRQKRGTLWVTTLARLAAHLIALRDVTLSLQRDGAVRVTNHGSQAIHGLTLTVAATGIQATVDGQAPPGIRRGVSRTDFWLDLPAGATRVVRISIAGSALRSDRLGV